ncbi:hypothetical protein EGR_10539 [Echinococcus granulosus]|uniref:Uncharacterized protein n=1 Tax=Echinococcus granulosus TaxID=6210 RepID=W6U247_ECHGR|nr:hypothetical protein EGR_10539 [Echinococcus granulosus]EUB54601.1 hypothetical protein EGR_10539 [Echinococcus granulosus]
MWFSNATTPFSVISESKHIILLKNVITFCENDKISITIHDFDVYNHSTAKSCSFIYFIIPYKILFMPVVSLSTMRNIVLTRFRSAGGMETTPTASISFTGPDHSKNEDDVIYSMANCSFMCWSERSSDSKTNHKKIFTEVIINPSDTEQNNASSLTEELIGCCHGQKVMLRSKSTTIHISTHRLSNHYINGNAFKHLEIGWQLKEAGFNNLIRLYSQLLQKNKKNHDLRLWGVIEASPNSVKSVSLLSFFKKGNIVFFVAA